MGSRMTVRLLSAGYDVTVWNRTSEKTRPLAEAGAAVAASPAAAAAGKDMVLCNLTDGAALKQVVQGAGGVLSADPLPRMLVDFATIAPSESAEIAGVLESSGVAFLRAPVSGTTTVAEAGRLTLIVSGERAVFEAAAPVLAVLGQTQYYVGSGEKSRYLKLIHQMMIAANMQVWAEGLVMGEKAGLDWQVMLDVLGNSAVASGAVKGKVPTLAARDYENPAMSMHNIAKDLDLALEAAAGVAVELPATQKVRDLYERSLTAGREWQDYSAIVLDLEERAGLEPLEDMRKTTHEEEAK